MCSVDQQTNYIVYVNAHCSHTLFAENSSVQVTPIGKIRMSSDHGRSRA